MIAVAVIFGLVIGSFLNVVIDRLPAGKSIVTPPSHCPSCKRKLEVKDFIPVISYITLRGRCRYCAEKIPVRLPVIESVTGAGFGLIYWYGSTHWLMSDFSKPDYALIGLALLYFCLLLVIFVIDLDHQLILNSLVYPAMILALAISLLHTYAGFASIADIFIPTIASAGIGFGVGLVLFLLIVLLSRGGMGLGDVKMAALMGLMLGWEYALVGIFLGILAGGITAVVLLATRKKGRKQAIPFGPFLAIGTMLAMIWGSALWSWYTKGF
jgi:leader peptidase (prepilin peptidase)/N-methyltransferase